MSTAPIDALRALHEELWDPERGMDRYAPAFIEALPVATKLGEQIPAD